MWAGGGEVTAGNGPEPILHRLEVRIWCNAAEAATAYQRSSRSWTGAASCSAPTWMRNTTATRVLMTGYDSPRWTNAHGKPFLVLPIYLDALELNSTNAYAL